MTLFGVYGATAINPTLELKIKFGSTVLLDSGAVAMGGNPTNEGWHVYALLIVVSIGATGTLECQADGIANKVTAGSRLQTSLIMTNTGAITVDTTADKALTVTAQWGTSDAINTITLRQMLVEVLRG